MYFKSNKKIYAIAFTLVVAAYGSVNYLWPSPYRTGNVSTFHLDSSYLNDKRRIWLYLPPGYDATNEHYPILIMHDGQNVFDGNTSTHKGIEWRVDETLEEMISAGDIPPIVVAAIESTDTRHDEYLPERVTQNGITEGGNADQYALMLKEELLPLLRSNYRLKSGPQHTFVGGSSYGGILSFYLAMEHSETFGAALAFSPSVSWNNEWMKRTTDTLFWKHNVKLWVDMGMAEYGANQVFSLVDSLNNKGWQFPYEANLAIDGGIHFEGAWARRFPIAISWLLKDAVFIEATPL
jgi:predicted alpha/beta superfamily hydrolase